MSLLLNGAKTLTIAGTEMSCIEIYTGEAYTLPFTFTDSVGAPINCTGFTLGIAAKYYVADTATYNASDTQILLGNLSQSGNTYTGGNLAAAFTTIASGIGYIYVPTDITGPSGGGPVITLANSGANTNIVVVTMSVTRQDALSTLTNVSREPIGLVVRYQ